MPSTAVPRVRRVEVYRGAPGEVISLNVLPLASIAMPGFQRERYKRQIGKITAEFDATGYAFPVVASFKDEYLGIDGQQRLASLEAQGETEATVLLIEGVRTAARLAAIYLLVNRDRKHLNAFEKYVGALAAEDRGTLDIRRLIEDAGLEVAHAASTNGKVPVGAVTYIHECGGNELLQRVLYIRVCAWGLDSAREANEGKTLKGIATFLRRYWDKVNDDHLITVLHKQHPGYILQAIDRRRETRTVSYSDYVREQYNKGRRPRGVARI
jgi:hypothetical protein